LMGNLHPERYNAASRVSSKLDTLAVFLSEIRIFWAVRSLGMEDRKANVTTKAMTTST